jgi:hypothetical protein
MSRMTRIEETKYHCFRVGGLNKKISGCDLMAMQNRILK